MFIAGDIIETILGAFFLGHPVLKPTEVELCLQVGVEFDKIVSIYDGASSLPLVILRKLVRFRKQ